MIILYDSLLYCEFENLQNETNLFYNQLYQGLIRITFNYVLETSEATPRITTDQLVRRQKGYCQTSTEERVHK